MADLKTNYKDDVLDTSKNEKRKFRMIQNDDGTVSFEDATEYTQQGDNFGAADINATNAKINEQSQSLTNILDFTTCDKLAQTASTTDINIALDKNINDYKFIVLGCINGGRLLVPSMITVALFKIFANKHVMIGSGNSIIKCIYIDDMHIKLSCVTADYQAVVYGIK